MVVHLESMHACMLHTYSASCILLSKIPQIHHAIELHLDYVPHFSLQQYLLLHRLWLLIHILRCIRLLQEDAMPHRMLIDVHREITKLTITLFCLICNSTWLLKNAYLKMVFWPQMHSLWNGILVKLFPLCLSLMYL